MRDHGCQPPPNRFQVSAVALFGILITAFFVFCVPLLPFRSVQIAIFTANAVLVLLVLFLYIRCSTINPADPGVLARLEDGLGKEVVQKAPNRHDTTAPPAARSTALASTTDLETAKDDAAATPPGRDPFCCTGVVAAIAPLVDTTVCCRKAEDSKYPQVLEETLYCSTCLAHVRLQSKHCRSCNKCIYRFDHHCRWLNNCIGGKNYHLFLYLVAAVIVMLLLQAAVAATVAAHCFLRDCMTVKKRSPLSRGPILAITLFVSASATVAALPLLELLFFHFLLIHKGMTTYDYITAMRLKHEAEAAKRDIAQLSLGRDNGDGGGGGVADACAKLLMRSSTCWRITTCSHNSSNRSSGGGGGGGGNEAVPLPALMAVHSSNSLWPCCRGRRRGPAGNTGVGSVPPKGGRKVRVSAWSLAQLSTPMAPTPIHPAPAPAPLVPSAPPVLKSAATLLLPGGSPVPEGPSSHSHEWHGESSGMVAPLCHPGTVAQGERDSAAANLASPDLLGRSRVDGSSPQPLEENSRASRSFLPGHMVGS